MSHPLLKTAIRFFFISILLILPVKIANACLCGPRANVLEAYDAADEVLIVRVLSLETIEDPTGGRPNSDNSVLTIGRVERVYKGSSKINDQLIFGQSRIVTCLWSFDKNSINKEFLFYLKRPEKAEARWIAPLCGRSTTMEFAGEDLLYLDNQEKLRGKTRVSGMYFGTQHSLLAAGNRKIRISGSQKTYEIYTDEKGVYEIYDLPPGKYRIEPEIPAGWQFQGFYPRSTTSVRAKAMQGEFVLEPKKHANIDVLFRPANTIEGTIVGPNGNPLPSVCARLWRSDQPEVEVASACTNEKGRFLFESVVPGTYHLVLNPANEPTSDAPFPRIYYPGTAQREKAVVIDVGVGDKLQNLNMVVPAMLETVTVEGAVYFSNGRPAQKQTVRFTPTSSNNLNDLAQVYTDDKGRFSLKVFKGLTGDVLSEAYAWGGMFENCPAFDAQMRNSSQKIAGFKTPAIRIEAQHDIRNLVLRFSLPKCEAK